MKVCIILPTCLLRRCDNPFYLAYATTMAEDADYANFFREMREKGHEVILDYSPKLPRSTPNLDLYEAAVKVLRPTKIVLPGVDYDQKATTEFSKAFMRRLDLVFSSIELIGLLEGCDSRSLKEAYRNLPVGVNMLALPCSLEKVARREEIIRDLGIKEALVYLEIFSNPFEEIPPKEVKYLCTSFPVRLALDHKLLREFWPCPPALNFKASRESLDLDLVGDTIRDYMEILK